jgi:long-chain acyl-CoA synthetase
MALLQSLSWEWDALITSILACIIVILWMKLSQNVKFIKRQAEIALSRRPGESAIVAAKQNLIQCEESPILDIGSLADSFIKSMDKYKDLEYFRVKSESGWNSVSWCQVYEQASDLGSGLKSLGLVASTSFSASADFQNSLVGILLKNSSFWIVSDHACSINSLISVPIHVSFNTQDLKSVLNHSKLTILITSLDKLKDVLKVKSKYLKFIILTVDSVPKEFMQKVDGVEILSFKYVLELGRKSLQKVELPLLNNVFTICYTSGTTGDPKGVMLTHGNMIEAGKGLLKIIPHSLLPGREDAHLSFLPMSHIFERLNIHGTF